MDDELIERVLRVVEQIPPGQIASYGEVGGIVGIGPRQVGWVMSNYGSTVPWWRVTNAAGMPPAHLAAEVHARWAAEGSCPGARDAKPARTDLHALADAYDHAVADLNDRMPRAQAGPRDSGGLSNERESNEETERTGQAPTR